jgi:hypothetical protein
MQQSSIHALETESHLRFFATYGQGLGSAAMHQMLCEPQLINWGCLPGGWVADCVIAVRNTTA